ncbi:unnamed protein product [Rotaria magnacalcarata]|uniref:Thiopurine S-methyltransferase n=1 Tax=Rotaria magnacalcarata TaxID=392030 RepID=A0A819I744_9BILA|nr:unnamed protein product [Rotaria magnacalcarata]
MFKSYNINVTGVECSALAIEELLDKYVGRNNYTTENRSPTCSIYSACKNRLILFACDIFADELTAFLISGCVSFVWDRAALTSLHPVDHIRYIEKLRQRSDVHAQYLINVYWHPEPADQGPPFSISADCINTLFPCPRVARNERWEGTTYQHLRERCYRIEIEILRHESKFIHCSSY